jgi:hypothetical protein
MAPVPPAAAAVAVTVKRGMISRLECENFKCVPPPRAPRERLPKRKTQKHPDFIFALFQPQIFGLVCPPHLLSLLGWCFATHAASLFPPRVSIPLSRAHPASRVLSSAASTDARHRAHTPSPPLSPLPLFTNSKQQTGRTKATKSSGHSNSSPPSSAPTVRGVPRRAALHVYNPSRDTKRTRMYDAALVVPSLFLSVVLSSFNFFSKQSGHPSSSFLSSPRLDAHLIPSHTFPLPRQQQQQQLQQ